MDESIENFTKRKAPNAYVLFAQHFMNNYRANQPDGMQRYRGGIPQAIEDPLIIEAWRDLSEDDRITWKTRAKEEKHRFVNEYSYRVEQYVSKLTDNGQSTAESDEGGGSSARVVENFNAPENRGGPNGVGRGQTADSNSVHLKRLLRPQKKRKIIEDSKYAPTFLEDVSSAKRFEEKRRRERDCLASIWIWRCGDDKSGILKESFFLVSSQSIGVREDLHTPGTFACVEFSVEEGIKRDFACVISENTADWKNDIDMASDCALGLAPSVVCQELFGEWLRAPRRDLSSKTPVFFCLVDEYAETYDALSFVFAYKDGAQSRFPPYLLATTDDLTYSLLKFFKVPMTADGEAAVVEDRQHASGRTTLSNESFPLSRVIDQGIVEFVKSHGCESHRKLIPEDTNGESGEPSSESFFIEKQDRCPLAVTRACAEYVKNWLDNGRVDDQILATTSTAVADEVKQEVEKEPSVAESLKSEDIDRFSYLALSESGDGSDRTLNDSVDGQHDENASNASVDGEVVVGGTDESGDIVEILLEDQNSVVEVPVQQYQESTVPVQQYESQEVIQTDQISDSSSAAVQNNSPELFTAFDATIPVVFPKIWGDEFRFEYETQLRLPNGYRGLGRGIVFGSANN